MRLRNSDGHAERSGERIFSQGGSSRGRELGGEISHSTRSSDALARPLSHLSAHRTGTALASLQQGNTSILAVGPAEKYHRHSSLLDEQTHRSSSTDARRLGTRTDLSPSAKLDGILFDEAITPAGRNPGEHSPVSPRRLRDLVHGSRLLLVRLGERRRSATETARRDRSGSVARRWAERVRSRAESGLPRLVRSRSAANVSHRSSGDVQRMQSEHGDLWSHDRRGKCHSTGYVHRALRCRSLGP